MDDRGQIKAKREAAARARRLAAHMTAAQDRERALAFARDLDAEADALERGLALKSPPGANVTQMQMQVQQGPPAKKDESEQ
jgi:alkanesulfonate monooxygenase SsuD/methylene tetrahydromethanopterin reductase-like flavin-dependent oxidoreductase (luciferase family)